MKGFVKKIGPYLFLLPHYSLFLIFFLIPAVSGFLISFCKWDFVSPPVFVGLHNYKEILVNRSGYYFDLFWRSLYNTAKFVFLSVPCLMAFPLLIAAALKRVGRASALLQGVFYFPSLLSVATVVLTWRWMLDRTMGIVNQAFHLNVGWTTDEPWFWIAVLVLSVWWGLGGNLVIYLAGMADIAEELYEAASIDGAGFMKKFRFITLPGLRNQLMYTLVMTTIASFNIYGQPVMLSGAASMPMDKSVLIAAIRTTAFGTNQNAGLASAMAMVLGGIIMGVSVFQFRFAGHRGKEGL